MSKLMDPIEQACIEFIDGKPYSKQYQDFYFSDIGAIQEKSHVFINGNELESRFVKLKQSKNQFTVGELGFGLGFNFLLTWQLWHKLADKKKRLNYIAFELHPAPKEVLAEVYKRHPKLKLFYKRLLAKYPILTPGIHRVVFENVNLTLVLGDALANLKQFLVGSNDFCMNLKLANFKVDCWYLDGFAPNKNPALWDRELLKFIYLLSKNDTTLSSYSVARSIKNALEDTGFIYTKKMGIGRKREYLVASLSSKPLLCEKSNKVRQGYTPWHAKKNQQNLPVKSIAIIGGGAAGCILGHKLAERDINVTIFEAEPALASLASGNALAMVHFKLSPYDTPLNQFMLSSFMYAIQFYKELDEVDLNYGVADLVDVDDYKKLRQKYKKIISNYPQLCNLLSADEISKQAGINISLPGFYWPSALIIKPRQLVSRITKNPNISVKLNANIDIADINERENWPGILKSFDKIIFTLGASTKKVEVLSFLDIQPVPGVVYQLAGDKHSNKLDIGLSFNGYITPALNGEQHIVGGGYHKNIIQNHHQCKKYLNQLSEVAPSLAGITFSDKSLKKGTRAKGYDYLPYVGPVPIVEAYQKTFAKLKQDKNIQIASPGAFYNDLYLFTGFGSHGYCTIPLAAEALVSHLFNEPMPVSQEIFRAISPARCIIRDIIKN